jgi:hypothetical protein
MAGRGKTLDIKKRIGIHETELIPNDIQVETYKRTTTQNESWEDQTVIQDSAKYLIQNLENKTSGYCSLGSQKNDAKVLLRDAYNYLSRFGEMEK